MIQYPRLNIDKKKIKSNTRTIVDYAVKQNIKITGVTKCCCGDPEVGSAMLAGGAVSLADSRLKNLKRLRKAGLDCELMLLRTPMLSSGKEVVEYSEDAESISDDSKPTADSRKPDFRTSCI